MLSNYYNVFKNKFNDNHIRRGRPTDNTKPKPPPRYRSQQYTIDKLMVCELHDATAVTVCYDTI